MPIGKLLIRAEIVANALLISCKYHGYIRIYMWYSHDMRRFTCNNNIHITYNSNSNSLS